MPTTTFYCSNSTYIHTVVREVMQTMQQDVITDVNSQVSNNVVVEDAQYGSDIVAIKMNDKFIAELHISKQR